jgi:uncharacterized protein YegJ (DUF2314 family)
MPVLFSQFPFGEAWMPRLLLNHFLSSSAIAGLAVILPSNDKQRRFLKSHTRKVWRTHVGVKQSLLLCAVLFFVSPVMIAQAEPDIRYRSIVYLYPSGADVQPAELSKYAGLFEEVDLLPDNAEKPFVSIAIEREIADSLPVPDLQYLSYFGRGLSKEQAVSIQNSRLGIVMDFSYPRAMAFEGLKASATALYEIATTYNGVIWDSETRELFGPASWSERRIESWNTNTPNVSSHTVIHAYQNGDGVRAITLGMAKFSLPDIVVNDFSWSLNRPMGDLVNLVAQSMVEGVASISSGALVLDINKLEPTTYKQVLMPTLKDNAKLVVELPIGQGEWEEGDPDNYLLELVFESEPKASSYEKQHQLLSSLFGWEDYVAYVNHNQLIQEASDRARKNLDPLKADFNAGLAPGEFIQLKAPFDTDDGAKEWMWVEVISWDGQKITGLLKNEPQRVSGLRGGAEVTVDQADIFDYVRTYPDGRQEGNETSELIMKYQL